MQIPSTVYSLEGLLGPRPRKITAPCEMLPRGGRATQRFFCQGRSWQPGSSLTRDPSRRPAAKTLVGSNVHGESSSHISKPAVLEQPLFRRGGVDTSFSSGAEAARLVSENARYRDADHDGFLRSVDDLAKSLVPVFDAQPKTAWAFKHLIEPER